jgi:hypothetical protein
MNTEENKNGRKTLKKKLEEGDSFINFGQATELPSKYFMSQSNI